ncbi:MAG: valine--tRNA ligase [Bacteroidetes bacterium GWA2_40_14]|nr:MAG: valine--tRNA ligase [Bacteroidetes bacterium GWA2_40_14]OFX60682.1 MAG: valine--tRNA ligase [Bacteroidetes bacterium GWC2_40_13]HAZ04687.1 valine--tRNA ligase [Marinilabiliales bacterium]
MNKHEIATKYNPASTEDKWYKYWMDNGFFRSTPDHREPYTIVIPPPNVTGVLHMGHMLNNSIQDILVRRARMQGKNACWVPGTDHASIATEAKVVAKLKDQGIDKSQLTRDEFMEHAWEWKEKHGGIILDQLKKLGASCDWDRTRFTMDGAYYESVINVFIDLYKKGLIYRGVRMVNWDPQAKTAVSDEEVIYKEVQSKLYYLRYKIEGTSNEFVTIATTRPETILGDTAVCVNPKDGRFTHLVGKRVLVPLLNRSIPIIQDDYVDMEFGTGCLKITPAHDINDYEIGMRHNLESIDIFNDNGTLSGKAQLYVGKDRFVVRKEIVPDLEKAGHVAKIEDYANKIGYSERTDAVIEPKLSMQWFMKMKNISKPALETVLNDNIQFHPAKFKNTYKHWMENIQDWCISRQLWWGHRIPAYYLPNSNDFVVAKTVEEALQKAIEKTGNKNLKATDLHQDEDVMDTWFSSWLWPIAVFDGIRNPKNRDVSYYYPTNDLVTAPEIMFFWVARMIIAGYEYEQELPFRNVYYTGIVRDKLGRKMSKSLGNSPDPIELMQKYGADGVRVGMLLCSPAGGDLLFDESLPEQGRNFANKIWNAFRLVTTWEVDATLAQPESSKVAIEWFNHKLNQTMEQLNDHFDKFRLSDALMTVYRLFWDEFSSWYLEMVKPAYQTPCDKATFDATIELFEKLLKVLHPFMPFITEEIWQIIAERTVEQSIMNASWPSVGIYNTGFINQFEDAKTLIAEIRTVRKDRNISFKDSLVLHVKPGTDGYAQPFNAVVTKMGGLSAMEQVSQKSDNAAAFMVKTSEFFIPLGSSIDVEAELKKLAEELAYHQGFLKSVAAKLSNEKFVNGAPEQVVAIEQKKQADAEAKIKAIEEQMGNLKK